MAIKFTDMAFDDYINYPALSQSSLKLLEKSPKHMKHREEKPPTPALEFGKFFHLLMLEPERFDAEVAVYSGGTKRGKDFDEFKARHDGKSIISIDDYNKIMSMKYAMQTNRTASAFLRNRYRKEQTFIWKDATYDFECKGRPDVLVPIAETLADIKTTTDASIDAFQRQIYNLKYHWQAAWYLNGINSVQSKVFYRNFVFIAIEKSYPYAVAVYRASQLMLDYARKEIKPLLELYNRCLETDTWEGYPDEIQDIYPPAWAS